MDLFINVASYINSEYFIVPSRITQSLGYSRGWGNGYVVVPVTCSASLRELQDLSLNKEKILNL